MSKCVKDYYLKFAVFLECINDMGYYLPVDELF